MRNGGRREEDGRARRELDDEAKVPEYKVAALIRVEVSQSSHSAPPVREVCKVPVLLRHDLRSEVDRCGGPDAVGEVAAKGGVGLEKVVEGFRIVPVQFRPPGHEGAGSKAGNPSN